MDKKISPQVKRILDERFGHDTLISLATVNDGKPYVRTVNSYYENGAFYVITYALSQKMKQIEQNASVAICGDWFAAHGIGVNMGYLGAEQNREIAAKLKKEFASWYSNGHINENDKNTCILCIQLTSGILFDHGTKFDVDFGNDKNTI